jgi:hypothetical protein
MLHMIITRVLAWHSPLHPSLHLQELPETAPPGQLPHSAEIVLEDDLVDKVGRWQGQRGAGQRSDQWLQRVACSSVNRIYNTAQTWHSYLQGPRSCWLKHT